MLVMDRAGEVVAASSNPLTVRVNSRLTNAVNYHLTQFSFAACHTFYHNRAVLVLDHAWERRAVKILMVGL